MKTLLFTLEYPPFHGGIANYAANLVKHWPVAGGLVTLNNNNGALIKPYWPCLKWLPAIMALRKEIIKNRVGHILVGHVLPLGLPALIIRKLYGLNYSVIIHGLDFSLATTRQLRKKIITYLILKNAHKIICGNSLAAEAVAEFVNSERSNKVIVVHPGVEENSQFPLWAVKAESALKEKYRLEGKIILLTVGRLVKRKGVDKVIAALPEALKKIPNLIYIILGEGEEAENIKTLIKNYGLKNYAYLISGADDEQRNIWYYLCHIFIMASRNIAGDYEGFGIVYLEANQAGKPVIAGKSGGVGDAVIDGLNGLLVNPESTGEISQAIIKLALDRGLRERLGHQGKLRAADEFSWEKQTNKIYKNIFNLC
ncbi:MAG: glycosyltransferase family 4 protein [bacterium]|nr:glycosyltransferase family 4 protein [bacterium]